MILQKNLCILVYLMLLVSAIKSQDITLQSGNKSKSFKANTFLEIVLPASGAVPCEKCSYNVLSGKLISYQNDIVTMLVYEKKEVMVSEEKVLGFRETSYTEGMLINNLEIPKGDILSISQNGKKKVRTTTTGQTIATVIGLLGLGHLASIPFAGENGELLAAVGATEVVVALILGVSSTPKTYVTHSACPDKPKHKVEIWMWE